MTIRAWIVDGPILPAYRPIHEAGESPLARSLVIVRYGEVFVLLARILAKNAGLLQLSAAAPPYSADVSIEVIGHALSDNDCAKDTEEQQTNKKRGTRAH